MKKVIKTVDSARGIVQCTVVDERYYYRPCINAETGLPDYETAPSVTYVLSFLPTGPGLRRWLANSGSWDEAEAARLAAADRGSVIHQAIAVLLGGKPVRMEDEFLPPGAMLPREITVEEYEAALSFADWWATLKKPRLIAQDLVLWGDKWAGTLDVLGHWDDALWLIDLKSGQHIGTAAEAQVSTYRDGVPLEMIDPAPREAINLGILQVGYRANQRGWKFTPVNYQPELFAAAYTIYLKEAPARPVRRELPLSIDLATPRGAGPAKRRKA